MNSPEKENLTEKSTCESCGKVFDCGAKTGNCWCFSIAMEPQDLAQLKQQFKNCLCQECLSHSSLPKTSTEKTTDS